MDEGSLNCVVSSNTSAAAVLLVHFTNRPINHIQIGVEFNMRHFIVCAVFVVCGMTDSLRAQDWPSWRGPYGTGVANGSNYPVKWSEKTIAWKYQLAGIGASTPAVSGDNIIVTLTKGGQNTVLCVGIDGQQKWTQTFGKALEGKSGQAGTGANPSPVIHDGHVFVYFKSGDFGCFDLSGHLKWQVNVFERFANVTSKTLWWDLGASPVLTSDAVVITMLHSGPSYLAALDRETGEVKWKYDRETNAPREAAQSYTTPIVTKNPAGQEVIIVTGADYVTCHSATDGKELWRFGTLNPTGNEYFRSISSSVSQEGIVVAPYSRGQTLTAIKMGGSGDVTKSHLLWSNNDTAADVVTPVVHGNRIFVVRDVKQDRGIVDCLELASGKMIWSGRLEKNRNTFRSSPIYADGRLYVARMDGTVFVVDADADEFRVLSKNVIANETTLATPVLFDGKVLLRTEDHLYLIAN